MNQFLVLVWHHPKGFQDIIKWFGISYCCQAVANFHFKWSKQRLQNGFVHTALRESSGVLLQCGWFPLIHKQLEMHGRILSTDATDALVLKHQAISVRSADYIFIVLDQFYTEISYSFREQCWNMILGFEIKYPVVYVDLFHRSLDKTSADISPCYTSKYFIRKMCLWFFLPHTHAEVFF